MHLIKKSTRFTDRFSIAFLAGVLLVIGGTWSFIQITIRLSTVTPWITFLAFFSCVLGGILLLGIFRIYRENARLRQSAYDLHEINHIYRDVLARSFSLFFDNHETSSSSLLSAEQETLNLICRKIANLFTNLIGRKCIVTVKLLLEAEKKFQAFTWARSEDSIHRRDCPSEGFSVFTRHNSAFDEALKGRPGTSSYFYSPNLFKEQDYKNEREGWWHFYKSTIVVPIRAQFPGGDQDVIGFLTVDTKSTYRLNDTYHIQFLAAFADQMYNFMSLMRRTYSDIEKDLDHYEQPSNR